MIENEIGRKSLTKEEIEGLHDVFAFYSDCYEDNDVFIVKIKEFGSPKYAIIDHEGDLINTIHRSGFRCEGYTHAENRMKYLFEKI